jgi:hypothetical protein
MAVTKFMWQCDRTYLSRHAQKPLFNSKNSGVEALSDVGSSMNAVFLMLSAVDTPDPRSETVGGSNEMLNARTNRYDIRAEI